MDIRTSLTALGLERFADTFIKNDIDLDVLRTLTDAELRDLGVDSLGARKKILGAISGSVSSPASSAPSAGLSAVIMEGTYVAPSAPAQAPTPASLGNRGLESLVQGGTLFVAAPPVAVSKAPAPSLPTPTAGQTLNGRYLLLNELGAGAMGVVFRGFDNLTTRDVAIKMLRPEHSKNPDLVSQMIREVALAQAVTHPKLLRIHNVEPGPPPFIVMELIDGETLKEKKDGSHARMSFAEVKSILADVLEALQVLHDARIVHRDIKPANVMIARTGEVKLSDYGVASTVRDQLRGAPQAGTLLYMSPEQLRGERADARSDLYAVGIMAYELLVGRFPFEAASADGVKAWHLSSMRDLASLKDSVGYESILRAVATSPGDRWASASEMRAAILAAESRAARKA